MRPKLRMEIAEAQVAAFEKYMAGKGLRMVCDGPLKYSIVDGYEKAVEFLPQEIEQEPVSDDPSKEETTAPAVSYHVWKTGGKRASKTFSDAQSATEWIDGRAEYSIKEV